MARFEGVMPAIVTPMKDGTVDTAALAELAAWQVAEGCSGVVACGTTGEGATLTAEETLTVVRTVKDAVGGRGPVIAGTGSNDTAKSVELTRKVAELGVDAALVVTPYYNKPNAAGLKAHYAAVAKDGGLPVIMYNVPGRTGLDMSVEAIVDCAGIDGVVGIKEASASMPKATLVRERLGDDFTLLSGDDFTILPFMACGGDGVITVCGNVVPKLTSQLVASFQAGNVKTARQLQARLLPFIEALFVESNPVPVKAALEMMGRIGPELRLPLAAASDATRAKLKATLASLEVTL